MLWLVGKFQWAAAIGICCGRNRDSVGPVPDRSSWSRDNCEKPETSGSIIVLEAIPETLVILGFVVASMIIIMIE